MALLELGTAVASPGPMNVPGVDDACFDLTRVAAPRAQPLEPGTVVVRVTAETSQAQAPAIPAGAVR